MSRSIDRRRFRRSSVVLLAVTLAIAVTGPAAANQWEIDQPPLWPDRTIVWDYQDDITLDYWVSTGWTFEGQEHQWEDWVVYTMTRDPGGSDLDLWIQGAATLPNSAGAHVHPEDSPCNGGGSDSICTMEVSDAWDWYTGVTLPVPSGFEDARSMFVHEVGHLIGIDHCVPVPGHSDDPYNEMNTMCYSSPAATKHQQRTVSNFDLQAANYMLNRITGKRYWFTANSQLDKCGEEDSDHSPSCVPTFWNVEHAGFHTWASSSGGSFDLEVGQSHAFQEMYQIARSPDLDGDDNGRFRIDVKARSLTGSNSVVTVFLRQPGGANEETCVFTTTTVMQEFTCAIDTGLSWDGVEYGARVPTDTRVLFLRARDKWT